MTETEMDSDIYSWNQCPPKIIDSCKTCGSHCYCDRWKGYQQGRMDERQSIMLWFVDHDMSMASRGLHAYLEQIKEKNE